LHIATHKLRKRTMATTLRLPFLLAFVVLSIPPWPAASPAELGVITDHLATVS
jgi:hypothetical protein